MYKQGDILLIPIPFTDLTSNKKDQYLWYQMITIILRQMILL